MQKFGLIFRHYVKRTFMHKGNLLAMLLLPTAIILLFAFVNDNFFAEEGLDPLFYGYNVIHTDLVIVNLLFFQLFGALNNVDSLHEALSTESKWRLFAAPVNRKIYPLASMLASWIVSLLQAIIVLLVTSVILNVYWGNIFVNILALLGLSLFAQILGVLIFLFTKNNSQGQAIGFPLIFIIGGLSGIMIPIRNLIDHSIVDFIADWSPLQLAMIAIREGGRFGMLNLAEGTYTGGDMSLAMRNVLIVFTMAAVIGIVSFTIGKVKKAW